MSLKKKGKGTTIHDDGRALERMQFWWARWNGGRLSLESRNVQLVIRDGGACIFSVSTSRVYSALKGVGLDPSLTSHRYTSCMMLQQKFNTYAHRQPKQSGREQSKHVIFKFHLREEKHSKYKVHSKHFLDPMYDLIRSSEARSEIDGIIRASRKQFTPTKVWSRYFEASCSQVAVAVWHFGVHMAYSNGSAVLPFCDSVIITLFWE